MPSSRTLVTSSRKLVSQLIPRDSFVCLLCRNRPPWSGAAAYSTHRARVLGRLPSIDSRQPAQTEARQATPRESAADPDSNFSVRYFEQDEAGVEKELESEDAFNDSFDDMPEFSADSLDLKEMFDGLKDDPGLAPFRGTIQAMQDGVEASIKGITDPELRAEAASKFLRALSKTSSSSDSVGDDDDDALLAEDMAQFEQDAAGDETWKELMKDVDDTSMDKAVELHAATSTPQIPTEPWTPRQLVRISKLNGALFWYERWCKKGKKLPDRKVFTTWKTYYAARKSLSEGWAFVPASVWSLLWTMVSSHGGSTPARRSAHLAILAKDMAVANVDLTPTQQLAAIGAFFESGQLFDAVDRWKRAISTLGEHGSDSFELFWRLGVTIFCKLNDLAQVIRAIDKILANGGDARILMTLMVTYSQQGTAEGHDLAWETYRQMREALARSIKIEDYDQAISVFLATGQVENALQAFVDMMTDGKVTVRRSELDRLPFGIGNKYFFGKWIKRLIWMGDLDGAEAVIHFMQSKDVQPAAVQLNGLIGAWQRSKKPEYLSKADKLAGNMIDARLTFVEKRRATYTLRKPVRMVSAASPSPALLLPRATVETFRLMAKSFQVRRMHEAIVKLWASFQQAEMSPDTFTINRILESYRLSSQLSDGWRFYDALAQAGSRAAFVPDAQTFAILFEMLTINRAPSTSAGSIRHDTVQARQLFAALMGHAGAFQADGQLARAALHTFRRLGDRAGFVVALVALRTRFGFAPLPLFAIELLSESRSLNLEVQAGRDRASRGVMLLQRAMRHLTAAVPGFKEKDTADRLCICLQNLYQPSEFDEASDESKLVLYQNVAGEMGALSLLADIHASMTPSMPG